jgi:large subunit ribosomal protein L21
MHAVIRTGGKQYRVAPNEVIKVERLAGEAGDVVVFDEVLAVGEGDKSAIGAPTVAGASVAARVIAQDRADKILIFKKKRRHNYRRKNGHRQHLTVLRIEEILTDGKKPTVKAEKPKAAKGGDKPAAKPKAEEKPAAEAKQAEATTAEATTAEAKPAAKTEAKPAAKKPAAKKPAAKKPAAKSATKSAASGAKTAAKPAAKKPAAKKPAAKKDDDA